jgi:hypothetical protein
MSRLTYEQAYPGIQYSPRSRASAGRGFNAAETVLPISGVLTPEERLSLIREALFRCMRNSGR